MLFLVTALVAILTGLFVIALFAEVWILSDDVTYHTFRTCINIILNIILIGFDLLSFQIPLANKCSFTDAGNPQSSHFF